MLQKDDVIYRVFRFFPFSGILKDLSSKKGLRRRTYEEKNEG